MFGSLSHASAAGRTHQERERYACMYIYVYIYYKVRVCSQRDIACVSVCPGRVAKIQVKREHFTTVITQARIRTTFTNPIHIQNKEKTWKYKQFGYENAFLWHYWSRVCMQSPLFLMGFEPFCSSQAQDYWTDLSTENISVSEKV